MKVVFKVIKAGSGNDIYFERLSKALKKVNIESEIEYYPKYFQYSPWLLKLVNKKTPADIIHSNVEYGWVFKEDNKPLYVTLHHNVFDTEYRKYTTFAQRFFHDVIIKPNTIKSLKHATKIIAVSNYTKDSFIKTFGKYPIDVIYNFIDTDKYSPQYISTSEARFKLLFVGNLTKRKGADLLPEIMEKLGKDFVLYYTSGLRTKIPKEFNLPNMIPLGKLSEKDLIKEYNKCDALLFPSRLEGFGYVVAEAMSCGKPVVALDNSSMPELVLDGPNNSFVKNKNVEQIIESVQTLKKILHNDSRFIKLNRNKIKEKFSLDPIIKRYENIYS